MSRSAPLALALEVRPVTRWRCFDLGQLRLQRLDAGFKRGGDWAVTGR
jgi:hypothetical protein